MAELKNTRHELFSRCLVAGKTADQAYQDAGYKASRAHASRLAAKGNIRQRVSELHQAVAQAATIDRAWVLAQMQSLYPRTLARVRDYLPRRCPDCRAAGRRVRKVLRVPACNCLVN